MIDNHWLWLLRKNESAQPRQTNHWNECTMADELMNEEMLSKTTASGSDCIDHWSHCVYDAKNGATVRTWSELDHGCDASAVDDESALECMNRSIASNLRLIYDNKDGRTAVMSASKTCDEIAMTMLLDHGCFASVADKVSRSWYLLVDSGG
jgi:hypothetical protein